MGDTRVASDDVNKRLLRIQGTSVFLYPMTVFPIVCMASGLFRAKNTMLWVRGLASSLRLIIHHGNVYPSGVVTSYMSNGIRGNNVNDVFVTGSFFEIVHYNETPGTITRMLFHLQMAEWEEWR